MVVRPVRKSATIPTMRFHGSWGRARKLWPTASPPGQNRFANVSLTTTSVNGSPTANTRPDLSGNRITEKYAASIQFLPIRTGFSRGGRASISSATRLGLSPVPGGGDANVAPCTAAWELSAVVIRVMAAALSADD